MTAAPVLAPGSTIGILGGGQLGRMLALAAARLGLRCHIFCPDPEAPAFDVAAARTLASYDDAAALHAFAGAVDVVTFEFENVPAATAALIAANRPVLPDPSVLATTQDRLAEKTFVGGLGLGTADHAAVDSAADLAAAVAALGRPALLKTRRFGYDGKGQAAIGAGTDLGEAWAAVGGHPSVLEKLVAFEREVSVIAARGQDGTIQCFDVTENEHRGGVLRVSRAPAAIPEGVAREARRVARAIGEAFGYVGVFTVEMFMLREGDGHALLVNEIAPRVHNSGHWTLDAATVSQFEQHVRAIAGWPLGVPERRGRAEMVNLIGDEVATWAKWLSVPGASVHLYGKRRAAPGRKMGHVTRVFPDRS